MNSVTHAARLMRTHRIECTGPGEVTCAGCRPIGWMGWADYYRHLADMLDAEGLLVDAGERS